MNKAVKSILVLGLLALPLPGFAQAPSLDDKIRHILEVSELERTFDVAFQSFRPAMIEELKKASDKITPEIAEHVANIATEEFQSLKPQFSMFVADFYKKQLTEEEVGALYDFYRTPAGSRIGRKMANILESLIPQTQTFVQLHFVPKFQARLAKDEKLRNALRP